jgi:hypothetical protein
VDDGKPEIRLHVEVYYTSFTVHTVQDFKTGIQLGSEVNGGAAGSTNASVCKTCPVGSYSNAPGPQYSKSINLIMLADTLKETHFHLSFRTLPNY